jgi:hypothetical protein
MMWFIIVAAVAALLVVVEIRSWKKPSRLNDSFQAGYVTPGLTSAGNDMGPRGLGKPKT